MHVLYGRQSFMFALSHDSQVMSLVFFWFCEDIIYIETKGHKEHMYLPS